jgi:hypothetical protein
MVPYRFTNIGLQTKLIYDPVTLRSSKGLLHASAIGSGSATLVLITLVLINTAVSYDISNET